MLIANCFFTTIIKIPKLAPATPSSSGHIYCSIRNLWKGNRIKRIQVLKLFRKQKGKMWSMKTPAKKEQVFAIFLSPSQLLQCLLHVFNFWKQIPNNFHYKYLFLQHGIFQTTRYHRHLLVQKKQLLCEN